MGVADAVGVGVVVGAGALSLTWRGGGAASFRAWLARERLNPRLVAVILSVAATLVAFRSAFALRAERRNRSADDFRGASGKVLRAIVRLAALDGSLAFRTACTRHLGRPREQV